MKTKESIAKRMRRLRLQKGLTIKEVAELIAVPASTYKEWEYGRAIQGEPYAQLATCFGVSLSELILGFSPEARLLELVQDIREIRDRIDFIERGLLSLI